MIRHILIAASAIGTLLLTGCASIVNGQNQSVSVVTRNQGAEVQGAKCSLTNDKGVWYLSSPGSVAVHRSFGDLAVSCAMTGLPDGTAAVKSSTTSAVFGNILVGGVIGAGIDVATGAAYNYPNLIPVAMGQATRLEGASDTTALSAPAGTAASAASADAKLPYVGERGQAMYREYLTKPAPRAFAIAPDGRWGRAWTEQESGKRPPRDDSRERALANCKGTSGIECQLYAVNDQVFVPTSAAAPAVNALTAATEPSTPRTAAQ